MNAAPPPPGRITPGATEAATAASAAREPWIDRRQLRALLRTYFRIATRLSAARFNRPGRAPTRFWVILIFYALFGLPLSVGIFAAHDVLTFGIYLHSVTFCMLGLLVMAEAGNILLNPQEDEVLGHQPIHPRTLIAAKLLNLTGITMLIALSLNLFPTLFAFGFKHGNLRLPLAHAGSTALISLFAAALVVFLYGWIIRLVGRRRFDQLVVWAQVVFSLVFMVGSQMLPRMIQFTHNAKFTAQLSWLAFLPPAWFAGLDAVLGGDTPSPALGTMAAAAVLATLVLSAAAINRLAAGYGEVMAPGRGITGKAPQPAGTARNMASTRPPLAATVPRWLNGWVRDPVERAVFRMITAYMWRDRDVRLRLFPAIGYFIFFPIMGVLTGRHSQMGGPMLIMPLCFICMIPLTALDILLVTTNPAPAEMFYAAPLEGIGRVFQGVRKAVLVYIFFPLLLLMAVVACFLRVGLHDALLLAPCLILVPPLTLISGFRHNYLPFSIQQQHGGRVARQMVMGFGLLIIIGGAAAVSYFSWKGGWVLPLLAIEAPLVALVHWALLRALMRRPLRLDE